MADQDHTAHARPVGQSRPTSASSYKDELLMFPLSPANAKRQTDATKLRCAAIASQVIQRLLANSKALYLTEVEGGCPACGIGPFNAKQTNGLYAALHYLREYATTLTPASSG